MSKRLHDEIHLREWVNEGVYGISMSFGYLSRIFELAFELVK